MQLGIFLKKFFKGKVNAENATNKEQKLMTFKKFWKNMAKQGECHNQIPSNPDGAP